ncbi:uncharacterized protein LOC129573003 [Sitodiplosis mosellana]|uniref:uncharacterized protein LOC129573003 n=1 Tax=Sitodiplosis mosellana TaxID=263140 RepID=UPI00244412C5|nr:uncharacterized protein LOC129573003 [Sitodiplosis mosellana]
MENRTSNTGLAGNLHTAFVNRFNAIYQNQAMKAAIFLDPRYRGSLVRDQLSVETAKEFMKEMHQRLGYLREADKQTVRQTNDENSGDDFDIELAMNEYFQRDAGSSNSNHLSDIEAAIDAFDPPHMQIKENLFDYWGGEGTGDNDLHAIAMAIYAIPPTETQTERNFSDLKRILSDFRGNLSRQTLENILTCHLNKDLYLDVIDKQLKIIRKK